MMQWPVLRAWIERAWRVSRRLAAEARARYYAWRPRARGPLETELLHTVHAPLRFGGAVAVAVLLFFGVWGGFAPMDAASVAPGTVVLDSSRKTVQHLEGGIINEILVKEGDYVEAGQPLVRLNPINAKARQEIVSAKLLAARAAEARLLAEQEGKEGITLTPALEALSKAPDFASVMETQTRQFTTRRAAFLGEKDVLKARVAQLEERLTGIALQKEAAEKEQALFDEEIATVEKLVARGLSVKPRLLALKRQRAELEGNIGGFVSDTTNTQEKIGETRTQMINLERDYLKDVAKDMEDTRAQIADLEEQRTATNDVLGRTTIAAPQSGVVTGLKFHTVGGVVGPGAPILDIVPQNDALVVEARISPQDIDQVHEGLHAKIRLSAYRSRFTPRVGGEVFYVSADRFTDEHTQMPYYLGKVKVNDEDLRRYKGKIKLYPGMPAEVFVVTGSRTLMDYLLSPLVGSVQKAFAEE